MPRRPCWWAGHINGPHFIKSPTVFWWSCTSYWSGRRRAQSHQFLSAFRHTKDTADTKVPVGWWRIQWQGLPPRFPTWPLQSWPRPLWWSHWGELTAGCLARTPERNKLEETSHECCEHRSSHINTSPSLCLWTLCSLARSFRSPTHHSSFTLTGLINHKQASWCFLWKALCLMAVVFPSHTFFRPSHHTYAIFPSLLPSCDSWGELLVCVWSGENELACELGPIQGLLWSESGPDFPWVSLVKSSDHDTVTWYTHTSSSTQERSLSVAAVLLLMQIHFHYQSY